MKTKSYKLITTNRINEHIADYATDYIKIKETLKEKANSNRKWFDETIKTYVKSTNIETVTLQIIG
jgi:peptidyl-prolyl cis-trans isomerase SurA